jgi:transposase
MILSDHQVRVWLYQRPTDMRKSFTGLIALVKHQLYEDPLSGHLFAFINKRRNYMKVLYYAHGGFCIWSKRLTAGQFALPAGGVKQALHWNELMWLIDGIDVRQVKYRKRSVFAGQSNRKLLDLAHEQRIEP